MNEQLFTTDFKIIVLDQKKSSPSKGVEILTLKWYKYTTASFAEDIFSILVQQKSWDKIIELKIPYEKQDLIPKSILKNI